jgi:hypothetical protein
MRFALVMVGAWLMACVGAWGNGVYVPEQAVEAMPQIPSQRAIIRFRDGVQTLVVESTAQSASARVGWILPLPAEPTTMEKGEPGMLVSATLSLRQKLIHDLDRPWAGALWLLVVVGPFLLVLILTRPGERRRERLKVVTFTVLVAMLLVSVLLPSLGGSGGEQASGASVLSTQRVGNYDVTVLKAAAAEEVGAWVASAGLRALPAAAMPELSDYVQRGWCFAVAVLRLPEGEAATPHPLVVSFPAASPVFPMKLTALAGSQTRVELVTIGEHRYGAEGFDVVACDRFGDAGRRWEGRQGSRWWDRLRIASPAVMALLWPDCVVTHLRADLVPGQMTSDVALTEVAYAAHRDVAWTARGRAELAASIVAFGLLALAAMVTIACNGRRMPSRGWRRGMVAYGGLLVVAVAAVFVVVRVVPTGSTGRGGVFGRAAQPALLHQLIQPEGITFMEEEQAMRARVLQAVHADAGLAINDLQGGLRRWEHSPGNLGLMRAANGYELVLYDIDSEASFEALIGMPSTARSGGGAP